MQEANGEGEGSPAGVFNLVEEILSDNGGEGLENTCLQTFRRFVGDLQRGLQQTERELSVGLTSDPESEFFVDLVVSGFQNHQKLFHEFETQVAVLQHDPTSGLEAFLHRSKSFGFLAFSHRNSLERIFLFLSGQLFDRGSGIGTGRKQEENGLQRGGSFPDLVDRIGNRSGELFS